MGRSIQSLICVGEIWPVKVENGVMLVRSGQMDKCGNCGFKFDGRACFSLASMLLCCLFQNDVTYGAQVSSFGSRLAWLG